MEKQKRKTMFIITYFLLSCSGTSQIQFSNTQNAALTTVSDMAKVIHKSYNQNDSLLLPPSLGELIPKSHPVRIVSDIFDKFDISAIESTYKGGGTSSFHPRMLLKVVVYAYLCNIYSGRQMEKRLHENIHFMWLARMSRPDRKLRK